MRRDVVILGSTGSVGTQALDVVRRNPDRFRVVGLTAGGSQEQLFAEQVAEFAPAYDGLGEEASVEAAALGCDVVLNAITGAVGLRPTVAALEAGNTLALANKESLIIGGPVVTRLADPGQIVPVDSEHSALAQCLRGGAAEEVSRLVLTASGGPFRGRSREDLRDVTPEEALAHPTWDMGPVVTINSATLVNKGLEVTRLVLTASGGPFRGRSREDLRDVTPEEALAHPTWDMGPVVTINSATLVNKGLEVIEAHLLFGIPFDRIEVVVHPTSVVHSMVEFTDGSTLAQASPPTMLIPIALGLSWPDRVPGTAPPVDWTTPQAWEFFPLDDEAFPAVRLAREAGERGGTAPAVFNAANEVCVEAFRTGRLPFTGIVDTISAVLQGHPVSSDGSTSLGVDEVLAADGWARDQAASLLGDIQ